MTSHRLLEYAVVAALSLALGVGVTLLAIRRTPSPATDTTTSAEHEQMPGMGTGAADHPTTEKGNVVYISPARQQLIGVRTARVETRSLATTIRAVGTLAYDETRMTRINTKIAGWVDRVDVDYVGKPVRRGDPLLALYSPQLVATQREYLLALENHERLAGSSIPGIGAAGEALLTATRDRLKLWDISDAQIEELARTRRVQRTLTLYAPFDGVVLERDAFPGQYITPEMTTFRIADLSTIWAYGEIFEYELPRVRVGQRVEVDFPYGQVARKLEGRLAFIYPDVDPQTRRVKVRAEFPNPGFAFKPETYVTLTISVDEGRALGIPREALIDTGLKRYVILAHPNGYFEPREVEVAAPVADLYPLTNGLREGDVVVTSALFLIDSETNLKAAMQAMSMSMPGMDMGGGNKGAPAAATEPAGGHAGHQQ